MSNISSVIKSLQDVMRQDSGVDGDAQRISQLTWLLFLNSPPQRTEPTNEPSSGGPEDKRHCRHELPPPCTAITTK